MPCHLTRGRSLCSYVFSFFLAVAEVLSAVTPWFPGFRKAHVRSKTPTLGANFIPYSFEPTGGRCEVAPFDLRRIFSRGMDPRACYNVKTQIRSEIAL